MLYFTVSDILANLKIFQNNKNTKQFNPLFKIINRNKIIKNWCNYWREMTLTISFYISNYYKL